MGSPKIPPLAPTDWFVVITIGFFSGLVDHLEQHSTSAGSGEQPSSSMTSTVRLAEKRIMVLRFPSLCGSENVRAAKHVVGHRVLTVR